MTKLSSRRHNTIVKITQTASSRAGIQTDYSLTPSFFELAIVPIMKVINLNGLYTHVGTTDIYKHEHNHFVLWPIKSEHTLKGEDAYHLNEAHCLLYVLTDGPFMLESVIWAVVS